MAAPDIPHPARAPILPQNSAEFHRDSDDLGASASTAAASVVLVADSLAAVPVGVAFDDAPSALSANRRVWTLVFGTVVLRALGVWTRRWRRMVDATCRVAGERISRLAIMVDKVKSRNRSEQWK